MKTLLVAIGTRPEAIKMCELIRELKAKPRFEVKLLVTGQHKGMLKQVLDEYGLIPDYDLGIMKIGQTLSHITTETLKGADRVISELLPDIVLVHGDTSSAFSVALAAFYRGIDVAHVEAGLRTHNILSPFPEEFNRTAISLITRYHFAPTERAKKNLLSEGVRAEDIFVTGNTVIDALVRDIQPWYNSFYTELARGKKTVIMTVHRRENLCELYGIFSAVRRAVEINEDIFVIYPVHKNEKILSAARKVFSGVPRVYLCEPIASFDFHNLLNLCKLVLTDSGGVQEEAAYLGKPTLVLRNDTERKELLSNSTLKLVGTDEETIFSEINIMLKSCTSTHSSSIPCSILGDGTATKKIADILEEKTGL